MILHQGKRYNQVRVLNPTPLDVNINGTTVVSDILTDVNLTLVDQNGDDVPFTQTGSELEVNTEWVRPTGWIDIPSIANGEEVIYILFRVNNESSSTSNRIAFQFEGAYTVDWGDGSALENFASAVTAYKQYTWSSVSNDFQGYRQALIKITPQIGNNITRTFFTVKNIFGSTLRNPTNVLDIVLNVPNISAGSLGSFGSVEQQFIYCQRVWIKQIGAITTLVGTFGSLPSIKSLPLFDTSNVLNFNSIFAYSNIRFFPSFVINSNCISFNEMTFNSSVETFNSTINVSATCNFNRIFSFSKLKMIGSIIGTSSTLAAYSQLFDGAVLLQETGNIDIPTTSFSAWFQNAVSLRKHGVIPTTTSTRMDLMYSGCRQMISTSLNCANITNTTSAFLNTGNFESILLNGLRFGISIANNRLEATALNDLFTSLGTASGSQTITITGNPGATTCNTSIATAKGFTVVI